MITLIVRAQRTFVPDSRTVLPPGDRLQLVAANDDRANVERRVRAVSRAGRLARWRGEDGRAIGTRPDPDRQPPTTPLLFSELTRPAGGTDRQGGYFVFRGINGDEPTVRVEAPPAAQRSETTATPPVRVRSGHVNLCRSAT